MWESVLPPNTNFGGIKKKKKKEKGEREREKKKKKKYLELSALSLFAM